MPNLTSQDFTISIASVARSKELDQTLTMLEDFPNIQVILDGANLQQYAPVINKYEERVNFIVNQKSLGVSAVWNEGIICSNTRYVILSSDHLIYPKNWFDSLLAIMGTENLPLQVSLSFPMSFSCFCIDKTLIALQGWFDHNFTRAYFEDEDWYLRFRERLGLYNNPISYEKIIPMLKTVIRPVNKYAPRNIWNPIPNKVYFLWKWQRMPAFDDKCLHSRQLVPYKRRLPEADWPLMQEARSAYGRGDFSTKLWVYSPPAWKIQLLTRITNKGFIIWLINTYKRRM